MKRSTLFVLAVAVLVTGCGKDSRVDGLITRVSTLETSLDSLKVEHTKTREKLQALLKWVNTQKPNSVGLVDWIDEVHHKLWPTGGPSDPVKPAEPPPPF